MRIVCYESPSKFQRQDFQEKLSKFLATNKLFLVFKTNLNLIIF